MRTICIMFTLLLPFFAACAGEEQTPDRFSVSVHQFVEHPALDAVLKGFQDELRDKGADVAYSVHNAQANMAVTTQIAQQIASESPDLVLAIATPSAQAQAQIIKKSADMAVVPLLFTAVTDPVTAGLVTTPDKPGGNITGNSDMIPVGRHIDMILTFHPEATSLGILYNAGEANSKVLADLFHDQCTKRGVTAVEATAARSNEVYTAAKSLVGRVDAVYVPTDNTVVSAFESLVKVCSENKLPLYAADVDSVARGAIAALGFDYYLHGRQAGSMAYRILAQGQQPAETPVERQKDLKLHINLDAADTMGVEVPDSLLQQAEKTYPAS